MATPLFTCVIPVKGDRPFFKEALASLESQGLGDELEVIVQDGDVEPDSGQSDALNRGFAKANGEWLFWLNADDVLLPGALEKVRSLIGRVEHAEWIAGNEYFIDAGGRKVGCSVGNGWHDWLYRHAVPHVHGPSSFFRRELFNKVGGFDVDLKYSMDWDLWIKFMKAGARFERINDFFWSQRRWAGSKTQRDLSSDELAVQHGEIDGMLRRNGFRVTALGVLKLRLWRFLSGCYFREWRFGRYRLPWKACSGPEDWRV